jgi:PKD repeat protein
LDLLSLKLVFPNEMSHKPSLIYQYVNDIGEFHMTKIKNYCHMKKGISILVFCLIGGLLSAQHAISPCGTDQVMKNWLDSHPEIQADFARQQQQAKTQDSLDHLTGYTHKTAATVYTVPIVFHVLHQYGPENISDAQIIDAVNILNRDYRKKNADTTNVISNFANNIADVNFEFRLATKDPSGNCTTGITRHNDPNTNWTVSFANYIYTWPPNKYLNVYLVKTIGNGSAGYTFLPGSVSGNPDAIVILNNYVGSIGTSSPYTSRALTHEVGHWFNLSHVWGNTNSTGVACGDDGVSDTPLTKGWNWCPPSFLAKVCNSSITENYQNYMDYSYCTCMFTNGQATRMTNAINSAIGGRNNIWTNANLIATGVINPVSPCAPIADFTSQTLDCAGKNVYYADYSYNGTPTNWQWTFAGGTPSVSSVQNPTVSYISSGTKTVTLKVSNAQGADSVIKNTVTILPAPASGTTNLVESFETTPFPNTKWLKSTPKYGAGWIQNYTVAATGSNCVEIDNYFDSPSEPALIYSACYNLSGLVSPALEFKVAYSQNNSGNLDRLRVYSTTDCGQTWNLHYAKSGAALHTYGTGTYAVGAFTNPTASQWRQESVDLSPLTSANSSVHFKFEFAPDSANPGNNIFLDEINIITTVGVQSYTIDNASLSVYPNPVSHVANIDINLNERNKVCVELFDLTGKKVKQIVNSELEHGNYHYSFETDNSLSKGLYFLQFKIGETAQTKKLIIE